VLGAAVLVMSGYADRSPEAVRMSDFAAFWAAARSAILAIDPYGPGWRDNTAAALGALRADPSPVYPYFGWTLVFLYPFGLIDLDLASSLWLFGGLAAAAVALWALLRSYLPGLPVAHTIVGLALLASHPSRLNVLLGQWGFVLLAALAATVVWLRAGQPERAAIPAVLLLMKPQLFVLTAPALGVWSWLGGRRRFVADAVALSVVLVVVSIVLLPHWPSAWLGSIPSVLLFGQPRTTTLTTVFYGVIGPAGTWLALAVMAVGAVIALQFNPRTDASLAMWLALSAIVAPYTWSYDHILLLVPLVIAAGAALGFSRRAATLLIMAGTLTLLVVTTLLAVIAAARNLESFSAVVPVLVYALIVWALWPLNRIRTSLWRRTLAPPG
jgi:hypothetical protein